MEECLKEKQLNERTNEKEWMNEEQIKEELGRYLTLKLIKCLVCNRIQARLCSSHEKYQDQHKRTKKKKSLSHKIAAALSHENLPAALEMTRY